MTPLASSHSVAAVTSDSSSRTLGPITRAITKKSSSTLTKPSAPVSDGQGRSASTSVSMSSALPGGSGWTCHTPSSR
jgi:hypothetical protein